MLVLDDDDGAFVELAKGERAEVWRAAAIAARARSMRLASEQQLILDQANGRGSVCDGAGRSEVGGGNGCFGGARGSDDGCGDVGGSGGCNGTGKEAPESRPSSRSLEGSGGSAGEGGSVGGGGGGNGAGSDGGRSGIQSGGRGSSDGGVGGGDSCCLASYSAAGGATNRLVQSTLAFNDVHGPRVGSSLDCGGGAAVGAGVGCTASGAPADPQQLAETAVASAMKYMREQAGAEAPNAEQEKVIRDFFEVGPPKEMLVIGPPGTGKSTVFQACARGVLAMGGVPVMIAEYNPQVHALNKGLNELTRGRKVVFAKTRAGLFALPARGPLEVEDLVGELTPNAESMIKRGTHLLEDEYALDPPARMDVCNAICKRVRNDHREWGGMSNLKLGDPFQGDPINNEDELDWIANSDVQARVTLTSEGKWRRSGNTAVYVLTQRVRFTEPLFITGHMQIACGAAAIGVEAERVREVRTGARVRRGSAICSACIVCARVRAGGIGKGVCGRYLRTHCYREQQTGYGDPQ